MKIRLLHISCLAACVGTAGSANALVLGPDFATDYSAISLGSVPGLPTQYGGLTFKLGDPNTILIGGNANVASGLLYEIGVVRGVDNRITGFAGSATPFGAIGTYNDGGVVYGPSDVLFTAQWPVNKLGQTLPGSSSEDRVDDLGPLGIGGSSISALGFVPPGFDGAGRMKVVSWAAGNWYDVAFSPDGSGTFNLDSAARIDLDPIASGIQSLPGGPEGFVYIDSSSPGFSVNSLLVSDYSANRVSAYELDSEGNPRVTTRRDFLTGLSGAEGAAIDPLTGDFLFSTFGGLNQVVVVQGFVFALSEISGVKWEDLNGDGRFDPDEALLAGWPIQLRDGSGSLLAETTTDADGSYSFGGLAPGTYFVSEVLQAGWEQTFDATGGETLVVAVSQFYTDVNFGNRLVPIAEPAAIAVLGIGLVGLMAMRRRARRT